MNTISTHFLALLCLQLIGCQSTQIKDFMVDIGIEDPNSLSGGDQATATIITLKTSLNKIDRTLKKFQKENRLASYTQLEIEQLEKKLAMRQDSVLRTHFKRKLLRNKKIRDAYFDKRFESYEKLYRSLRRLSRDHNLAHQIISKELRFSRRNSVGYTKLSNQLVTLNNIEQAIRVLNKRTKTLEENYIKLGIYVNKYDTNMLSSL